MGRRFGTTEAHSHFGDDYEDYEDRGGRSNPMVGWGSPDGKGGFGPRGPKKKKAKKAKQAKSKKAVARNEEQELKDKHLLYRLLLALGFLVFISIGASAMFSGGERSNTSIPSQSGTKSYSVGSIEKEIQEAFLTENEYSRPGKPLKKVNGIVIHYVANPGSTAMDNRNYFENLRKTKDRKASAHFVIGIDGEIVQCIPLDEVAYCSNSRNYDTISIECCHKTESGEFTEETYTSLVRLTKYLMKKYKLKTKDVIRHYDVTGKMCPLYFVDHPEQWEAFLEKLK